MCVKIENAPNEVNKVDDDSTHAQVQVLQYKLHIYKLVLTTKLTMYIQV